MMNIFFWKKKAQSPYSRSFARRLTRRIMFTMLIVMSLTSALIVGTMWIFINTEVELMCDTAVKVKSHTIEYEMSEVSIAAINTVPDIEKSLDNPDKMFDLMKQMVELNPKIRSCGVSFIDNYYPDKGHWFCPYAVRRDSNRVELYKIGSQQKNYLYAPWFREALEAKENYWSKAFFADVDTTTTLVAYLAPIRDRQGQTVGVLGVDVSLDYMNQESYFVRSQSDASSWSADYSIYYFAIDSLGTYLMHPDNRRILRQNFLERIQATPDTLDNYVGKQMVSRQHGSYSTDYHSGDDLYIDGECVKVYFTPIANTDWSVAFVLPVIYINMLWWLLAGLLLTFILIGLCVVFFAGRYGIKKASQPLRQLADSADEVAKGNFETQLPDIQSHDEIHQLRDSFDNMQHSLTRYVRELHDTTAQKASMESELKVAHDIQMDMLPKTFPPYPERDDIDIFGSLTPAKAVGGDLFDFFIRDNHLFFCIGDVSGKGVPASLFMAVTRSLFRHISSHVDTPERILVALNDALTEHNEANMFVTFFAGVLNLATGHLQYCNAGHNAPLLLGRQSDELPCLPNLPLGILKGFQYQAQEAAIAPQTMIFLFTDGLTEAENAVHAQFGDDRIRQVVTPLLSWTHLQPKALIQQMLQEVHAFVGEAEQSDDLTMLAIQYTKTNDDGNNQ